MIGREMASLREQLDQMHSRAVLAEEERDEMAKAKDTLRTLLTARTGELRTLRNTLYWLSKGV